MSAYYDARPVGTRSMAEKENVMATEQRGFGSMTEAEQREIASKGGKSAHQKGTAHEWTPDEAREAGRKEGTAFRQRRERPMSQPGDKGE